MKKFILIAVVAMMATMTMTSCSKDDDDDVVVPTTEEEVVLNCAKPDYLKAGDRVAMISPSYFTPMETIEKAANGDQQMINTATITATPTPAATRMRMAGKID